MAIEFDAIPRLHQQTMLQVHVQGVLCDELTVPELGQQLCDDVGKDASVTPSVGHHSLGQAWILLGDIVQVYGDGHLVTVSDGRELGRVLEDLLAVIVRFVELGQEGFDGLCGKADYGVTTVARMNVIISRYSP